jgi:hypothetical protein
MAVKGDEGAALLFPFKMIIIIADGIVYFLKVPNLSRLKDIYITNRFNTKLITDTSTYDRYRLPTLVSRQ